MLGLQGSVQVCLPWPPQLAASAFSSEYQSHFIAPFLARATCVVLHCPCIITGSLFLLELWVVLVFSYL